MKTVMFFIGIGICLFFITTCQEEETPITSPGNGNMLVNTSFERGDSTSADGWIISKEPLGGFVRDTPPEGGNFSLQLEASTPLGGTATITVPVLPNRQLYRLSFWAKADANSEATAVLDFISPATTPVSDTLNIRDSIWTEYSLIDSFQVSEGDSLRITFNAGISELILFNSYFDLCKLQAVEFDK